MNIKGSIGRSKKECLSKYCEKLELRASYASETTMLSYLFNTIAHGGKVTMQKDGDKGTFEYVFPGMLRDEPKSEKEQK